MAGSMFGVKAKVIQPLMNTPYQGATGFVQAPKSYSYGYQNATGWPQAPIPPQTPKAVPTATVPVQPAPKPPKQPWSFDINSDPFVKAAQDALPGIVSNAQAGAHNSIIARLLQYGDPGLSGLFSGGAMKQMLANLGLDKLGSQAVDLLKIDPETAKEIAKAYGAESDPGVARDLGPSGLSLKAQFDRAMAQAFRQRLGNLTSRGAVRSGDLGYQTREQQLAQDVGTQNLVQQLLSGISMDVSTVDAARQAAQKAIDDAIQNARNAILQNPENYAASIGAVPPTPPAPAAPGQQQNPLEGYLTPSQFGILQSVFGGMR